MLVYLYVSVLVGLTVQIVKVTQIYPTQFVSVMLLAKYKRIVYFFVLAMREHWIEMILWSVCAVFALLHTPQLIGMVLVNVIGFIVLPYLDKVTQGKIIWWFIGCQIMMIVHYYVALVIVISMFFALFKCQYNVYHRPFYESYYLKYKAIMIAGEFLIVSALVYLSRYWNFVPFEQIMVFVALYSLAKIDKNYTTSLKLLLRFRARFYLNLVKKSRINFSFLSQSQVEQFMKNLVVFSVSAGWIGVFSNQKIEFLILMISVSSFCLLNIDVFIYHYLLQRSIVYRNTVVREGILLMMSSVTFSYLMFTMLDKILSIRSVEMYDVFSKQYSSIVLISSILLISMLIVRQQKLYWSNNSNGNVS